MPAISHRVLLDTIRLISPHVSDMETWMSTRYFQTASTNFTTVIAVDADTPTPVVVFTEEWYPEDGSIKKDWVSTYWLTQQAEPRKPRPQQARGNPLDSTVPLTGPMSRPPHGPGAGTADAHGNAPAWIHEALSRPEPRGQVRVDKSGSVALPREVTHGVEGKAFPQLDGPFAGVLPARFFQTGADSVTAVFAVKTTVLMSMDFMV